MGFTLQLKEKRQMSAWTQVQDCIPLNVFVQEPHVTFVKIFRISVEFVSRNLWGMGRILNLKQNARVDGKNTILNMFCFSYGYYHHVNCFVRLLIRTERWCFFLHQKHGIHLDRKDLWSSDREWLECHKSRPCSALHWHAVLGIIVAAQWVWGEQDLSFIFLLYASPMGEWFHCRCIGGSGGDFWESFRHSFLCRRSCPSDLRDGGWGWPVVLWTLDFPPPADLVDQKKDLSAKASHLNRTHWKLPLRAEAYM